MNDQKRKWRHWAYLNEEGKKLWGDIFPDGVVPVKVMFAQNAILEGQKESMKVFLISHDELAPDQLDAILIKLSNKFSAPKEVIKKDIMKSGLPLRAELTSGSGTNQAGLFL